MNQNNNIIGYDSQTGQPIYGNQNTNIQQPMQQPAQPQMNTGYTQQSVQTPPPKKRKKGLVIVALLIVVGIVVAVLYFNNQDKKEPTNNETPNNSEVENNNNQNNEQQENNNSTDNVEEGTNTTYDENGAFLLGIEDIFNITGRGTVVWGKVERGKVKIGDTVQIVGLNDEILTTEVTGISMVEKTLEEATAGDDVGIFLKDITKEQVQRGQVLAKPNSIVAATKFDANVYILTPEEGGRHTPFIPFYNDYKPQFYFIRTAGIIGTIALPEGVETVMPGDNVSFTVTLISPVAMEVGTEFSIREGNRTVGKGTVTKVY